MKKTKIEALYSILYDLTKIGCNVIILEQTCNGLVVDIRSNLSISSKSQIRESMAPRRLEMIRHSANWIRRIEPNIVQHFANGEEINPILIKLEIKECTTTMENDIFRYCRFLSSVPYSDYVGRRIKFIIRDASIPRKPIIGITAMGSPILQIRCRDEWIGWNSLALREIKKKHLTNFMDLYVAIAIPPYNHLLCGKLLIYMMVSNEVRNAFQQKYKSISRFHQSYLNEHLVLLVTTGVYGNNSSQYNRIKYHHQQLVIPIGETSGYTTLHISERTFAIFRQLLSLSNKTFGNKIGDSSSWRLRVCRIAMNLLGLPSDLILQKGSPKGVYVIPLAHNVKEFLNGNQSSPNYYDYPLDHLISFWRERWLRKRVINPQIIDTVNSFTNENLRLTPLLNEIEN